MEFIFTLKYQLSEQDANHHNIVGRLLAAGCDDAVIGIGLPGRLALEFTREADSAVQTILQAISEIKNVIPSALLIEAAPDLVGLTDVAELVGVSRQNMRKLMLAYPGNFPPPVHEGKTSLWHLTDILRWLQLRGSYQIPEGIAEVALATMQVNISKEACRLAEKGQTVA
ncbi:helix-turn-helix transcriptional regulator [Tatumella sp. UBA2305]|uniref:helix-turn-helix transcriptional regulator n=1 Tax=Tatumella sp. UBA2305 TaxID=1947647 RepID=UPI0025CD3E9A|nr:DNA-binding protein [Tatumella sp. UBA2305]